MRIDRIKLICEKARQDIGTKALAEKANVSRATITAMRGGKSCTANTAAHVARALGLDVSDLMESA